MKKAKNITLSGMVLTKKMAAESWRIFKDSITWKNQLYIWPVYAFWITMLLRTHLAWYVFVSKENDLDRFQLTLYGSSISGFDLMNSIMEYSYVLVFLSIPYYAGRKKYGVAMQCMMHAIIIYTCLFTVMMPALEKIYLILSV